MVKARYLKFFMIDFIEMSMRKVANQNTVFCSKEAGLFDNLMDEDLTERQKKQQLSRFENCLGKHTDSLEHALSLMSRVNAAQNDQNLVFEHDGEVNTLPNRRNVYELEDRGHQYLLSQKTGDNEPVYDSPEPKTQNKQ